MGNFDLRHVTIILIVDMFLGGGILDTILAMVGGNRSTISRTWLDLTGKHPELIAEMAYALTLFFFHLCFPRLIESPVFWVWFIKAIICLAPVARMVYVLHTSQPTDDIAVTRLAATDSWFMISLAVGGFILAIPAWWWGVPQHLAE